MDVTQRVAEIIEPTVLDMGYELVRVQLTGGDNAVLQIMAERADREDMLVDDCADISRAISALMDIEDPISGPYSLEVSSPGLDRPLTKLEHFDRFSGYEARVELTRPLEDQNRKRLKGTLAGIKDAAVLIKLADDDDGADLTVPFDQIAKAKLILTDALLAEAQG